MINVLKEKCLLAIIFLIIIASAVSAERKEIKCPEFCQCDVFEKLKRAVCQHKRLVSIELNIPVQAQVLDISYNHISELGDKIFLEIGLTNLKLLNLSHNKIHQIHFNGFEGLSNLKTLDLSFNSIQYFTKAWFPSLSSLQELYLRGNKLKSINDEPLIALQTLRVLDLSKCGITHLDGNIFTMLPNLEILDISENYLQRLKLEVIKPLSKLTHFKAMDNNFNCKDRGLISVKNYVRTVGISYKNPCISDLQNSSTVRHKFQMFEKIIEATTIEPKNLWIFDDEDLKNTKIIEVCSNGTDKGLRNNLDRKSLLVHLVELWPLTFILGTFLYGTLFGMAFTCAINLCLRGRRRKQRNMENREIYNDRLRSPNTTTVHSLSSEVPRRNRSTSGSTRSNSVFYTTIQKAKKRLSRDNLCDDEFDDSLVMNEFDLADSTPMPGRKVYV